MEIELSSARVGGASPAVIGKGGRISEGSISYPESKATGYYIMISKRPDDRECGPQELEIREM